MTHRNNQSGSSPTRLDDDATLVRLRAEAPDEQGIRRGLVEHIRQMIMAGGYDTPDRWERTEEILLSRMS